MARPPSKGVVSKRLIKLTGERLRANAPDVNLAVVAYFCGRKLNSVDTWVETGRINGGTALRLWHLFEAVGIRQPELKGVRKATPYGEYLGRLLVFGVVTPREAREIAGNVNDEAVYAGARGERDFWKPTFTYDELIASYDEKLQEKITLLKQWLKDGLPEELLAEVEPQQPPRVERKRTRGGQEVVRPVLPNGSKPNSAVSKPLPSGLVPTTFIGSGKPSTPAPAESSQHTDVTSDTTSKTDEEVVVEDTAATKQEQPEAEPATEAEVQVDADPAASWTNGSSVVSAEAESGPDTTEADEADDQQDAPSSSEGAVLEVVKAPQAEVVREQADTTDTPSADIDQIIDALAERLGLDDKQALTAFIVNRRGGGSFDVPVDRILNAGRREEIRELAQRVKELEVLLAYILHTFTTEELEFLRKLIGDTAFYTIKILATQLTGWRAQQTIEGGKSNG